MARFHRRLASFCRLIRFDQRGIGLSRASRPMDVIGPQLLGPGRAWPCWTPSAWTQATVFAAGLRFDERAGARRRHPDRVRNLIFVNGAARVLWAPDYPAGADVERRRPVPRPRDRAGRGRARLRRLSIIAPTVAADDAFRAWWDMSGNRAASPSMARAVTAVVADDGDVRDVLRRHHRPDADHASGATRRSSPSRTAATCRPHPGRRATSSCRAPTRCTGSARPAPMLDEIEEFITGVRGGPAGERVLATVLFTDIVGSTERAAGSATAIGGTCWTTTTRSSGTNSTVSAVARSNTAGDGFVATFASPSAAIDCAEAIVDAVRPLGIEVRAGHPRRRGRDARRGRRRDGRAHRRAGRRARRPASEVLVSSTVREIVTGSRRRVRRRAASTSSRACPGPGGCTLIREAHPCAASAAAPSVGAAQSASACRARSRVARAGAARRRSGRVRPPMVSAKPSGSSRSSAVGSRSGWVHTRRGRDTPCFSVTPHHSAAASRSRRGRSSSPTRVANVCSAGPPVARRRRDGFAQRLGAGHPVAGGGRDDRVDPALDQGEQRLQPAQRGLLLGCLLRREQPAGQRVLHALRIGRVDLAHRPLDRGHVDRDAAGVGVDRVEQPLAQPRHVGEQALVGGLAQRQVQPDLVLRSLEPLAEGRRRSAGPARRRPIGPSGMPMSVARHDLLRQAARALADLGAEHQAADLGQDRAPAGCPRHGLRAARPGSRSTSPRPPGQRPGRTAPPRPAASSRSSPAGSRPRRW